MHTILPQAIPARRILETVPLCLLPVHHDCVEASRTLSDILFESAGRMVVLACLHLSWCRNLSAANACNKGELPRQGHAEGFRER